MGGRRPPPLPPYIYQSLWRNPEPKTRLIRGGHDGSHRASSKTQETSMNMTEVVSGESASYGGLIDMAGGSAPDKELCDV